MARHGSCRAASRRSRKTARFIAQLDVDELDLDEWEEAGLMGCIYAFTGPEEKKAAAFWQYT